MDYCVYAEKIACFLLSKQEYFFCERTQEDLASFCTMQSGAKYNAGVS